MLFCFSFLNSGSDLGDIEQALRNGTKKKVKGSGSCSALVKLFDKNKELAISHVTWNDYLGMLRIYKFYNLSFHTTPSKGLFLSFLHGNYQFSRYNLSFLHGNYQFSRYNLSFLHGNYQFSRYNLSFLSVLSDNDNDNDEHFVTLCKYFI